MDNGIAMMIIAGTLISLIITYLIIQWAINASAASRQLKIQTNLLAKMAAKNGVSEDDIHECFDVK